MNCGQEEARQQSCLVCKCVGLRTWSTVYQLKPRLQSKPVGTILFQMQRSFSYMTSWRALKQWSAALQFVPKMTKSRKYKQGKVGDFGQRPWVIDHTANNKWQSWNLNSSSLTWGPFFANNRDFFSQIFIWWSFSEISTMGRLEFDVASFMCASRLILHILLRVFALFLLHWRSHY